MKQLGKYFIQQSGTDKLAQEVKEKLGINPIDYSGLTFKNRETWMYLTLYWTGLLSTPYFSDRVLRLRKSYPDYEPDLENFMPILQEDENNTYAFIEKMDGLCEKATGMPFPDILFSQTYPPNPGPFGDLLQGITDLKKKVPLETLDALYIAFGLRFSQKSKSINDPSSLTKRDMTFLANFLVYLDEHPKHKAYIDNAVEDETALAYLMLLITPSHPLYKLDWDESLVKQCFARIEEDFPLYEHNPQAVIELLELDVPPEG